MPHYLLSICQPFTDGPYAEGKEHVGGIYVISAPDLEAALSWGLMNQRRWSRRAEPGRRGPGRGR